MVGGGDGKIRLTDRKGKTTSEFSWGGNYISGLKFSPDASRIYSASAEGVVVWNLRTRSAIGTPLDLNRAGASLIGMSRDGKLVASGSRDGTVALWDAELRVLLGTLPIPGSMAFSLAFAPGGKFLVIGSGYEIPVDNSVVFWDLDPESWVRRSCAMAGRNLRPEEWQRYAGEATPEDVCSEGRAAGSGLMAR